MAEYTFSQTDSEIQYILNLAQNYVAAPFSSSTNYAVGDYCSRNGNIYRCKTAGASAWSSSRWTAVTLADEVANRGVYSGSVNGSGVSVPSDSGNTFTQIQTMAVSAGVWLIIAGTSFTTNTSGYRQIGVTTTNSITNDRLSPVFAAVNGTGNSVQMMRVFELSSAGTIYLWARQTSGSSLNCYPYIQAIRLK